MALGPFVTPCSFEAFQLELVNSVTQFFRKGIEYLKACVTKFHVNNGTTNRLCWTFCTTASVYCSRTDWLNVKAYKSTEQWLNIESTKVIRWMFVILLPLVAWWDKSLDLLSSCCVTKWKQSSDRSYLEALSHWPNHQKSSKHQREGNPPATYFFKSA